MSIIGYSIVSWLVLVNVIYRIVCISCSRAKEDGKPGPNLEAYLQTLETSVDMPLKSNSLIRNGNISRMTNSGTRLAEEQRLEVIWSLFSRYLGDEKVCISRFLWPQRKRLDYVRNLYSMTRKESRRRSTNFYNTTKSFSPSHKMIQERSDSISTTKEKVLLDNSETGIDLPSSAISLVMLFSA